MGVENAVHRKITESRRVAEPNKNKALERLLERRKEPRREQKNRAALADRPPKSREEYWVGRLLNHLAAQGEIQAVAFLFVADAQSDRRVDQGPQLQNQAQTINDRALLPFNSLEKFGTCRPTAQFLTRLRTIG